MATNGKKSKKKVIIFSVAGGLLLILAACALASRRPAPDGLTTVRVRVEQGDTLWAIAHKNTPVGLSTEQAADLIAKLNGLGSYDLVAGTELDVPVSSVSQNERLASK